MKTKPKFRRSPILSIIGIWPKFRKRYSLSGESFAYAGKNGCGHLFARKEDYGFSVYHFEYKPLIKKDIIKSLPTKWDWDSQNPFEKNN